MVKNDFLTALKKVGFLEINVSYIRDGDYYTAIRVSDEETAKKFERVVEDLGIRAKVKNYEKGTDIWVFRAYN